METKHSKRALWPLGWSSYLDPEVLLNDIPSLQFSWYKEWMLTQLLRHIKITKPHRMKQCQDGIDFVSVPFWRHPVGIDKPIFHRMGAQCAQVFFGSLCQMQRCPSIVHLSWSDVQFASCSFPIQIISHHPHMVSTMWCTSSLAKLVCNFNNCALFFGKYNL